ncbi:MAG: hypothetical protein WCG31_02985 [Deltaproteobacteria bacterium]
MMLVGTGSLAYSRWVMVVMSSILYLLSWSYLDRGDGEFPAGIVSLPVGGVDS